MNAIADIEQDTIEHDLSAQNRLHHPGRVNDLQDAEAHAFIAARLSRAMWLVLHSDFTTEDKRDVEALCELASVIADHASAAAYVLGKS